MTPRAFITVAALTGVAVIAAGWSLIQEQRATVIVRPTDDSMFPAIAADPNTIRTLEIRNRDYTLQLTREGDQWVAPAMGNYPVKTGPIGQMVAGLASLKPFEAKTDDPAFYAAIGVQDPAPANAAVAIVARDAAGATLADTVIGRQSRSIGFNPLGGTFIRRNGEAQTWLAEGVVVVPGLLSDWFDSVVHVPGPDVKRITILEGDTVVFDAEKVDLVVGRYELRTLDPKYATAEGLVAADNAIKGVGTGIVSTTFESARAESELVRGPDARTIRFTTRDDMVLEVRLGEIDGETWVAYSATAPAGSPAEARAKTISDRTAGYAFLLPSYRVTPLERQVADLVEVPATAQALPEGVPNFATPGAMPLPGQTLIPRLPGIGGGPGGPGGAITIPR